MSAAAVFAGVTAGTALWWPAAAQRLRAAARLAGAAGPSASAGRRLSTGQRLAVIALALAPMGLLPLPAALIAGCLAAALARQMWLRSDPAQLRDASVELPFAAELLAAALAAGASLPDALDAAAAGAPATAPAFCRAAALMRLGGEPGEAMADDPVLAPLARAMARAGLTGAAAGATLGRLAADLRAEQAAAAADRARRAGVHVVAPLVLCFLPAFVLVAVVPLVLGLAGGIAAP